MPSENQKATMNRPFSIRGLSALEVMIIVAAIAVIGLITFPGTTLLLEKYRLKQEVKLAMEKLNEMSTGDELTGLYNRRYFKEVLDRELGGL